MFTVDPDPELQAREHPLDPGSTVPAPAEHCSNCCFNDLDFEERGSKREDRGGWDGRTEEEREAGRREDRKVKGGS